jgi:hypothetical protein
MPLEGFESTIPASEQVQTYALRQRNHWDQLSGILYTQNTLQDSVLQWHCVIAQNVCSSAVHKSLNMHTKDG